MTTDQRAEHVGSWGGGFADEYGVVWECDEDCPACADERADPEGPALSGSHHSGANSRTDASPHGPGRTP